MRRHAPAYWLIILSIGMTATVRADKPAGRPEPIRYATSRTPGEGSSSGSLVDAFAPEHTPWDHPYVDTDAIDSMNNLRYGNLDALSSCGYIGGCGLGFLWSGSFGFSYNVGFGGLPR